MQPGGGGGEVGGGWGGGVGGGFRRKGTKCTNWGRKYSLGAHRGGGRVITFTGKDSALRERERGTPKSED